MRDEILLPEGLARGHVHPNFHPASCGGLTDFSTERNDCADSYLDHLDRVRDNPTSKVLHWLQSPDGTRALGISPGHYSEWGELFNTRVPLTQAQVKHLAADVQAKARRTPVGSPVLVLGGGGDYALPPACKSYPAEFLAQWKQIAPNLDLRFTGPGKYLDALGQVSNSPIVGQVSNLPQANPPPARLAGLDLPVTPSGARLTWTSFWIQCPKVKAGYRHAQHSLQSAEAAAAVASLKGGFAYAQKLPLPGPLAADHHHAIDRASARARDPAALEVGRPGAAAQAGSLEEAAERPQGPPAARLADCRHARAHVAR